MKVLLSAYACEPGLGSEPGLGWNWALQAARNHEVWIITPTTGRRAIEAAIEHNGLKNIHVHYHDLPRPWSLFLKHRGGGGYLHYYAWQFTALSQARKLHKQVGFDVAHHITYAGFRFPSFLFALGVPYVWGPVGGGDSAPLAFLGSFGVSAAIRQLLRNLSNAAVKYDPLLRATVRHARVIAVTTPATRSALPGWAQEKTVLDSQTALHAEEVPERVVRNGCGLKAIYLGRFLYWKGLHLGIEAVAKAREVDPDITLTLVGLGPEEERLRRLAEDLGVADAVTFHDVVPRDQALKMLVEHDCLLFPSLQDSAPFTVLEGMAAGLPVVCLKTGGPALSVTDETGFRIEPGTNGQVVKDLAHSLLRLAKEPELRLRMGAAGQRRIKDCFLWDQKADVINGLYQRALEPSE